jgi:hypothetical protein
MSLGVFVWVFGCENRRSTDGADFDEERTMSDECQAASLLLLVPGLGWIAWLAAGCAD